MSKIAKRQKKIRRHKRVRAKVMGTSIRPRLSVFRSNRHVWTQVIDDTAGKTIIAASDQDLPSSVKKSTGKKMEMAEKVGALIAQRSLEKKITRVVFDRGGYRYHGILRAVAEGARKGGLKF